MTEIKTEQVIYTGLFLDPSVDIFEKINPVFEKKYEKDPHVTLAFRPKDGIDGTVVGKGVVVKIIGQVIDNEIGIQACIVEGSNSSNKNPHITISSKTDVSPVKSNEAIASAILNGSIIKFDEPIELTLTTGYFNGQTVITK